MHILRITGGPASFGAQLAQHSTIRWDLYNQFQNQRNAVRAFCIFFSRFPKHKVSLPLRRPKPLYRFQP